MGEAEARSPRRLPSVDRVLRSEAVTQLLTEYAREPVTDVIRELLAEHRAVGSMEEGIDAEVIGVLTRDRINERWALWPQQVINATGVVLHTNLGRAPLSAAAVEAMLATARYSTLEYDLAAGTRGSRHTGVASLLHALTGAENAHLTVNNASAVLLALGALARGKEVLVSRGQAVEIGGGFRIPVILRQSGARLVEVGTTNRTRLSDYEEAITARTAAILHVHSSNFRLVGFTASVPLADLAELAHRRGLFLIDDNGSGSLLDTARFGLAQEPMPAEAVRAGADVVAFSGDKLLGGPQAGILVGTDTAIRRIAAYPLARAVRPDKMTLAGLAATLQAYLRGTAEREIPIWVMISQSPEYLAARAEAFGARAEQIGIRTNRYNGESTVGGGSLPGETLRTTLIALPAAVKAKRLREADMPVVARTHEGRVVLDLRTVSEDEETAVLDAICAALSHPH